MTHILEVEKDPETILNAGVVDVVLNQDPVTTAAAESNSIKQRRHLFMTLLFILVDYVGTPTKGTDRRKCS